MIHDVNVNERLKKYGFDLISEYEAEVAKDMRKLEKFSSAPQDPLDRLLWIINYVSNILDWELINHAKEQSKFQLWFDQKYPDIAKQGKKLLALVKRIGYDTPEKELQLFQDILRLYRLNLPIVYLR